VIFESFFTQVLLSFRLLEAAMAGFVNEMTARQGRENVSIRGIWLMLFIIITVL